MAAGKASGKVTGLQFSPWNLLLIIPLVVIVTPLFNLDHPRLFGMPFFYWFQFACVGLGVLCTGIVYAATRNKRATRAKLDALDVDDLDEGNVK